MKYTLFSMLIFFLLYACGPPPGRPLWPELQAIIDSMPKTPPGTHKEAVTWFSSTPDSITSSNTYDNQRQEMYDNAGNNIGSLRQDGSSWGIYDPKGNYQGRVSGDGIITNKRGDYIGQVK